MWFAMCNNSALSVADYYVILVLVAVKRIRLHLTLDANLPPSRQTTVSDLVRDSNSANRRQPFI